MNRNFNRIRFEDVKKAIENKGHFVMTASPVSKGQIDHSDIGNADRQ